MYDLHVAQEVEDLDLKRIAARLDDDESLSLKYRVPVVDGDQTEWAVRTDRLLDVAEDRQILYVDQDGEPAWVAVSEVIELVSDGE